MTINNNQYWLERTEQQLLQAEQLAQQLEKRMKKAFRETAKDIEAQIYRLYGKYGTDNGLTYADAKQYLTNPELQEFKQDLAFYLEKAKDPVYRKEHKAYLQALSTRARVSRLEEYQARMKVLAEELYQDELIPDATDVAKEIFTESYLKAGFDMAQFLGMELSFARPSEHLIKTMLEYPWSGKDFSQKWRDNCNNFETVLNEVLTKGLVAGYSNQKMAKELREKTNAAYHNAKRLVRTETNYIHSQATASLYESLGIEKYQYVATLDTRTSSMCQRMDGKIFCYTEKKLGVNYPPLHPWCRSTTIPIVYEHEDMGTRIARDENGKNIKVSADTTYEEWKEQTGLKRQYSREDVFAKRKKNVILTAKETAALREYISSGSYKINEKLRNRSILSDEEQDFVSHLDAALLKMPVFQGIVYRSVDSIFIKDVQAFDELHRVGNFVKYDNYTSSSLSVYDETFAYQFVIKSKTGRNIVVANSSEQEVLFARGMTFRIVKRDGTTIYLEEVEDG